MPKSYRNYYNEDWPEWFKELLDNLDSDEATRFLRALNTDAKENRRRQDNILAILSGDRDLGEDVPKLMSELKRHIKQFYDSGT